MRTAYHQVLRNLTFRAIKLETRLSDRQVAQLRWSQIHGDTIRTTRMRDCTISREVVDALTLLPHRNRGSDLVFFGDSFSLEDLERIAELEKLRKAKKKPAMRWIFRKSHKRVDKSAYIC